jgi:Flp pilus assembly protein TadG
MNRKRRPAKRRLDGTLCSAHSELPRKINRGFVEARIAFPVNLGLARSFCAKPLRRGEEASMFAAVGSALARGLKWLRAPRNIVRCTRGTSAVEFAIVAAPFIGLLVALFETAMVFFAGRVLDETVEEASRVILTGQAQSNGMSQTQFASWVCSNTYGLFNCGGFMINVQNYSSFSSASTATPTLTFNSSGAVTNTFSYNTGAANDIVVVQVMYQWPIVLGPLSFNLSNLSNGNRLLVSTAVFKNEPY